MFGSIGGNRSSKAWVQWEVNILPRCPVLKTSIEISKNDMTIVNFPPYLYSSIEKRIAVEEVIELLVEVMYKY